uniref:Nuclear pore complex protein DDB_G0274915-like n=1 Tax=Crassostrea virginica TaxID=6565 RepID=A0A8B8D160_CRAVI|nr:nuclear pore complex protein DDB_G0274915-like [Crassostrea virginica]
MCKFDLHDGQVPHVHCLQENEHCHADHGTLCCNDEPCIVQAFGQLYPTSQNTMVSPTTTTAVNQTVTAPAVTTSGSATVQNAASPTVSTEASKSPSLSTVTSKPSTTVKQPLPGSVTTLTPASSATGTSQPPTTTGQNNCTDDIMNCGVWLAYGVCHALPEQTSMYDLARQCKATCQLCSDVTQIV